MQIIRQEYAVRETLHAVSWQILHCLISVLPSFRYIPKSLKHWCLLHCRVEKKQEMEMKQKVETETGNWKQKWKPLSYCIVPVRFNSCWFLFLGIPMLSPLQFLIGCFASLALFPGLCHPCIGKLGAMVGNGATVPRCLCKIGPGYEPIICFTYCKWSKVEVGLGMRLQQ